MTGARARLVAACLAASVLVVSLLVPTGAWAALPAAPVAKMTLGSALEASRILPAIFTAANKGPAASFDFTSSGLEVAVNGSASSDTDGSIADYTWGWGDGTPSDDGVTATHTYSTAGTYDVTLTVTDDVGGVSVMTRSVTVPFVSSELASDAFERSETDGWGEADAGGSYTVSGGGASAASVASGSGKLSLESGASRLVALNAVSAADVQAYTTFALSEPPADGGTFAGFALRAQTSAAYEVLANMGSDGQPIATLRTGASSVLASYALPGASWEDGEIWAIRAEVTGANPSTVRLKVWNTEDPEPATWQLTETDSTAGLQGPGAIGFVGSRESSATSTTTVSFDEFEAVDPTLTTTSLPPLPMFTLVTDGLEVTLDGSGSQDVDGEITDYSWQWGDGTADGTGATPTHVYEASGTYTLTLTTTDADGASASVSRQVTVAGPPTTVGLSSSKLSFAAGDSFVLHAVVDEPLDATRSTLTIRDATNDEDLKVCAVGTECEVEQTFTSGDPRDYIATVGSLQSQTVTVSRMAWAVLLEADETEIGAGETTTLTATLNQDLSDTDGAYAVAIFNVTSGERIKTCDTSESCSVVVSAYDARVAATDYIAVVLAASDTSSDSHMEAQDMQAMSDPVRVTRQQWTLEIDSGADVLWPTEETWIKVTANQDVGGTNGLYSIYIFENRTKRLLARCDDGNECMVTGTWADADPWGAYAFALVAKATTAEITSIDDFEDVISSADPYAYVQPIYAAPWEVTLESDMAIVAAGDKATVTLTANHNTSDTEGRVALYIFDNWTSKIVAVCESGSTCEYEYDRYGIQNPDAWRGWFSGYVANAGAGVGDSDIEDFRAIANQITIDFVRWEAKLERTGAGTVTLTANQDVSKIPLFAWRIYTDDGVSTCQTGPRCVMYVGDAVDPSAVLEWIDEPTWSHWGYADLSSHSSPGAVGLESPLSSRCETTGGGNATLAAVSCSRADPVNTATGEFFLAETDLQLPGAGVALSAARTYSTTGRTVTGPFGYGWSANFGARLQILIPSDDSNPLPRQVEVEQENGSILIFTRDGSSSDYFTVDRVHGTLTWNATSDSWKLTRHTKEVLRFDEAGFLTSVTDLDGNALTFTYTGSKIAHISGSGGRQISIDWSGGRVQEITDSSGRSVTYSYNSAGDLTSVTAADGRVMSFEYDESHLMTAFVRPGGGRTENAYDYDGRVVEQTDPVGRITTFSYDSWSETTTMTRPDGVIIVDRHEGGLLVEQTVAAGTPEEAVTQYTYNDRNLIASVLDANGGVTTHTYDSAGNRTSTTDPLGRTSTWTYGAHRNPLTATDAEGRTTAFTYNTTGHRLTATTASGAHEEWTYNADGTTATHEDATGAITTYSYDGAGRLTSTTDELNHTTSTIYNAMGLPTEVSSPGGSTTTTTYDAAGRVLEVEDPLGNSVLYTYDAAGNLLTETNQEGETTAYTYDAAGQRLTITDPEGGVAEYTYDLAGNVSTETNPNGKVTSFTYDHYGNPLTAKDPLNRVTSNTYDLVGRQLTTSLPSGATTTYVRDLAGQVTQITDAAGKTTSLAYNDAGQLKRTEDPLGRVTTNLYDLDGQPVERVLPDASSQLYEYDDAGRVTTFTDADGQETTYIYGPTGLLDARTEPGGLVTEFEYDSDARIVVKTMPDGTDTLYDYDDAGRVTEISYSSSAGSTATFAYDGADRLLSVTDPTGTTTLAYDDAGRLVSEIDGSGDELTYVYDEAGQVLSIAYPGAGLVSYGYDDAGQMTTLTDWANRESEFAWTADSQLASSATPNGVEQNREYDDAGRTTSVSTVHGSTDLANFGYSYDDAGQLISQTSDFPTSNQSFDFDFDPLGQLAGTTRDTGATPATIPISATSAGKLTTNDNGSQLTYNAAQQVTAREPLIGPTTSYAYDANGARIEETTASTPATTTTLGYDSAGYLSAVTSATAAITYETDARGLRQTRDDGTTTEDLLWSTVGGLPRLFSDGQNRYIYGPSLTPLAQIDSVGDITYLHSDVLGSVRLTTDGAGTGLGARTYSEFGSALWTTGALGTPFGFTGNWTDPDTGLVHLRARDYDPRTGQFVSFDPAVENTRQPYTYASNNPVQFTDHTGLDFWEDAGNWLGGAAKAWAEYTMGTWNALTFGAFDMVLDNIPGADCVFNRSSGWYIAGNIVGVGGAIVLGVVSAGSSTVVGGGAGAAVSGGLRAGIGVTSRASGIATKNAVLATPKVGSARLQNIVNNLYKGTGSPTRVGNGTTMDAVRSELATGQMTAGKMHSIKATESMNGLRNWLRKNPDADHHDRLVAQSLLDELSEVMRGAN
jgi:RHS repeat-associated protein